MRLGRRAAQAAIGAGALGGAYAFDRHRKDEGFRRAVSLYSQIGPVVAHYRLVQLKHKVLGSADPAAEWEAMDERYSAQVVDVLRDLKGMYTKYGQIGASMTHTLSRAYTERLRSLENAVPPQPVEVVLQTVREETGREPSALFSEFDPMPLGAASIGQVHRARLAATGELVAVKVQYPDMRRLFAEDMRTIRGFLELAAPEQVIILDELERSFEREFDYTQEAANLRFFSERLAGFSRHIKVPRPVAGLSTPRMLVMELLDGRKMVDGIREYAAQLACAQGNTLAQFEEEAKERFQREGAPAHYEGPPGWQLSAYLAALGLRDAAVNAGRAAVNAALWALRRDARLPYVSSALPPNSPQIMDLLMRVHGEQLLRLGAFNADPHSGNFMLLRDGRIGLIDFGATKVLAREERLAACLLYAALHRGDKDKVMEMVRVSGYRSKSFDEDVIYDLCRFGFDTFGQDLLRGKNVQTFMDDLYARDPWYEAASNLTMAQFLSIRLRGVGLSCGYPVVCSDWWGPLAIKILRDEDLPYESWDRDLMKKHLSGKTQLSKGATSFLDRFIK
jgi:aarF domain-containing kinase